VAGGEGANGAGFGFGGQQQQQQQGMGGQVPGAQYMRPVAQAGMTYGQPVYANMMHPGAQQYYYGGMGMGMGAGYEGYDAAAGQYYMQPVMQQSHPSQSSTLQMYSEEVARQTDGGTEQEVAECGLSCRAGSKRCRVCPEAMATATTKRAG